MLCVVRLLRWSDGITDPVNLIRRGIEDRVVRAVEDCAVRLIHVEATHHSAAEHQYRTASRSAARTSAGTASRTTAEARAFAGTEKHHVSASGAAFPLDSVANFLDAVFELVRIHAKVLRLPH